MQIRQNTSTQMPITNRASINSSERSSSTSSSSSSASNESASLPPAQVENVIILPVVSPISLFKSLRESISAVEDELQRRQAMRLASASERDKLRSSELLTTRGSDFDLTARDEPESDNHSSQIILDPSMHRP